MITWKQCFLLLILPLAFLKLQVFRAGDLSSNGLVSARHQVQPADSVQRYMDSVVMGMAKGNKCIMTCKTVDARGRVRYAGYDGRRMKPVADFSGSIDIGSCSKMFTAAAILQLVEQGKFTLDDALTDIMPDPALYQGLLTFDGRDYIDSVSVRQLLNHSSGFADYFLPNNNQEIAVHGDSTLRFTPRQLIRLAARVNQPKFRPGTSFGYSNVNYILLGLIIEKFSGMTYQTCIQRNILEPLGMRHTYFASTNSPDGRKPGHYEGRPTQMPATIAGAAGEIISTLDDMQTFMQAWGKGRLFRKTETLSMLKTRDFHDMGAGIRYGLGVVWIPGDCLGHAGQTFGFSAYMGVLPNGSGFVFGIDDAAASAWSPAMALSRQLAGQK